MVDKSIDYCSSWHLLAHVCPQGVVTKSFTTASRRDEGNARHSLRDRLISRTSLIGTIFPVAPIANWALDIQADPCEPLWCASLGPMSRAYGRTFGLVSRSTAAARLERARPVSSLDAPARYFEVRPPSTPGHGA